jgi:hypothetical protein
MHLSPSTEGGSIVEAKVIARCCLDNSYWVRALLNQGDKVLSSMGHHEMKHKRMGAKTIFSTTGGLQDEIGDKLQGEIGELRQWMRDSKQYEDSLTLDPKEVCKARAKRILDVLSVSVVGRAPVGRDTQSLL